MGHQMRLLVFPARIVGDQGNGEGDDEQESSRRAVLLLSAFAQGATLMTGVANVDPRRSEPGNRPSSTILLDRLDARSLGR